MTMDEKALMKAIRESDPELADRMDAIDEMEEEVKDAMQHVMLDIAYSPVILRPGQGTVDAVEISYKAQGGRYVIKDPFTVLSTEEVTEARARYLVTRGKEMAPAMERMFGKRDS